MLTKIVRKSNDLVEGQYSLSIWEMRIFIRMVSMIYKDDTDFKEYRIEIGDFIKEFGLEKNKNAYSLLREGASGLLKKIIILNRKLADGTTEQIETPMVTGVAHNIDTKSYVKLSFHPAMKPFLIELKDKYLMYDVRNVLNLPSSYSIRMYEITKQYAKIGKRIVTTDELRRMLDIEDKYERYTHLKQKILVKCVEDINEHTDIFLNFEEIKKGRRVDKIQFLIKLKGGEEENPPTAEPDTVLADDLRTALQKIGIPDGIITKWRKKYNNQHIRERLDYIEAQTAKGEKIQNQAGYLTSLMQKKNVTTGKKQGRGEVTKKVNAILFSRPNLQRQIEAKHGVLSQEALNAVVKNMYPEKF